MAFVKYAYWKMCEMNYHTDIVIFFIGEVCLVERNAYSENLTFWRGAL